MNKKNHKTTEHDLQVECVNWFRENIPAGLIFAVPNCGTRNIGTYYYMVKEGLTKGAPDLVVLLPSSRIIFIEMKSPTGRLSPDQKNIQNTCNEISDGIYFVCRSLDEFKKIVN